MTLLLFLIGLVLLVVGAEALVRGASRMAGALGIPPLVVGLTVVAFGTSAPELSVSVGAALAGSADVAAGNVVGSNVFNVLFILGLSALIVPLTVSRQLLRLDVPLMIALSGLAWLIARDGRFGRVEGLALVAGLLVYVTVLVRAGRRASAAGASAAARTDAAPAGAPSSPPAARVSWPTNLLLVIGGLALLVLGSRWFVGGAVAFAQRLGVSELVIGVTIVAAGTSLPEVVTSVIAALRGERDIAVGNVVGSNVFNIMGVLGLAATVAPDGLAVSPELLAFDLPVMVAVALLCLPLGITGGVIARWEGALLLAWYAAYAAWLVLAATGHAALPGLRAALLFFALPMTVLAVAVTLVRHARRRPSGAP